MSVTELTDAREIAEMEAVKARNKAELQELMRRLEPPPPSRRAQSASAATKPSTSTPLVPAGTFGQYTPVRPPKPSRDCAQYHVGAVFGRLTLTKKYYVHPPLYAGYSQGVTRGWWIARCECGYSQHRVHTQDLRKETIRGLMCDSCRQKEREQMAADGLKQRREFKGRQPRSLDFPTRPPVERAGMVFGRLMCQVYLPREGWECICLTCHGAEVVKRSADLERRGKRPCEGKCRNPDTSLNKIPNGLREQIERKQRARQGGS
jgi:hypothetical protein